MNIIDWIKRAFGKKDSITLNSCGFGEIATEIAYKEVALNKVVNMIANSLCNCEFKTFKENNTIKENNYYSFNIEPNPNQNASEFRQKLIYQLITENECLIIQDNENFYVADSFEKDIKTLKKSVFYNVKIDDLIMKKSYSSSDVLYLTLNNKAMSEYVTNLYSSYGALISKGVDDYKKKNGTKGKLDISSIFSQNFNDEDGESDQEKMQKYISKTFKTYFTAVNAVLPLEEGLDFTQFENKIDITIDEINKGIDSAFNYIASAFGLPEGFFRGNLAEITEQRNDFLSFVVKPIAKLIEREINRKLYGKELYLKGSFLKVDTNRIKQVNIFDDAGSLDVLTRIGYSHNDLQELLEEPIVNAAWANKHYITKNYMDTQEGGDNNGKK